MASKDEVGRRGEQLAVGLLEREGYRVLDRNWRCRIGEIDIVAQDGDELVIVEVKSRRGVGFGHPFEAITPVKQARLRRLAGAWCEADGRETAYRQVRIDAIAVLFDRDDLPTIEHLRGVC